MTTPRTSRSRIEEFLHLLKPGVAEATTNTTSMNTPIRKQKRTQINRTISHRNWIYTLLALAIINIVAVGALAPIGTVLSGRAVILCSMGAITALIVAFARGFLLYRSISV